MSLQRFTRLGRNRHSKQLRNEYELLHRDYINRSLFGYIWIYNLLPESLVECQSVKSFQSQCQKLLQELAST
eukprot:1432834-Karenia_brevis.AAC.1